MAGDTALLAYIGIAGIIIHLLFANNYGYFRDELYYIVSGQHLQLGYVDFPPLIAYLAALIGIAGGDSLFAIHAVPAVVDGILVFVAGMIARELGGGRKAQLIAASATLLSGALALGSIFSMDILDALWWSLCAFIYIRLTRRSQPKLWIIFGLVAGLGLLTKLTIVFFLLAVVVAMLVTPARAQLRSRYFWMGAAIAVGLLLPYIVWNAQNGFPTVDFYINHGGLNGGGPLQFVVLQLLIMSPVNLPLAIAGLAIYLRKPAGRPYRVLGITYLLLLVVFTLTNAKPYFLLPAYPILFAAGALIFQASSGIHRFLPGLYLTFLIVSGVLFAPLLMPALPPAIYAQTYGSASFLGNGAAAQGNAGVFPQYLGDRFGWETMTATVAKVYQNLPPRERSQACIVTGNYGEASALIFLGKNYSLPPVISGHNNFYLWGPGSCKGNVMITVGIPYDDVSLFFQNVTLAATVTCSYCMNYENRLPVYVATSPTDSIQAIWPHIKNFS